MPRVIRPQRILAGPLRGRVLVTSWHDYPAALLGRTERPLLEWFARTVKPGETWLDVGAHYGYTMIALAELVGPAGRVFAFEPVLSTAGHLATTRRLNGLAQATVVPFALGAEHKFAVVQTAASRGMATHATADEVGEAMLVVALDFVWVALGGARPEVDGVKIDVQGMEIETLTGMLDLLRNCRPQLVVEVHSGVDRKQLLDVLASAGYTDPGVPIEPLPGETAPLYVDDRSYLFAR